MDHDNNEVQQFQNNEDVDDDNINYRRNSNSPKLDLGSSISGRLTITDDVDGGGHDADDIGYGYGDEVDNIKDNNNEYKNDDDEDLSCIISDNEFFNFCKLFPSKIFSSYHAISIKTHIKIKRHIYSYFLMFSMCSIESFSFHPQSNKNRNSST